LHSCVSFKPCGSRRFSSLFTFDYAVITQRQLWCAATPVARSATELPEQVRRRCSGADFRQLRRLRRTDDALRYGITPHPYGGREPPGRHHSSTRTLNLGLQATFHLRGRSFQPCGSWRATGLFTCGIAVVSQRQLGELQPLHLSALQNCQSSLSKKLLWG